MALDLENVAGITIQPYDLGDDFGFWFVPKDIGSFDDLEVVYVQSTTTKNLLTSSVAKTTHNATTIDTATDILKLMECPAYSSVILIILVATGILASLLGVLESIANSEIERHYQIFLHIFAANILVLIALPFTVTARFRGQWEFSGETYEVLSVVFSTAQTACAFQLTYLVTLRCAEVRGAKSPTVGLVNTVCCFLWLVAVACTWPTAVYDGIYDDVIKSEQVTRSPEGNLYIKINAVIAFIVPGLLVMASLVLVFFSRKRHRNNNKTKTSPYLLENVREAATLFLLFSICWLPYRTWRLLTVPRKNIPGCGATIDIFICIQASFSTIFPIAHYALAKKEDNDHSISPNRSEEDIKRQTLRDESSIDTEMERQYLEV